MALADPPFTRGIEACYRALARTSPLRVSHHLQEKLANQWLPAAQLRQLQWRRLQRMLQHCRDHVPFYQELWARHHVDPTRFTREEQLSELPIVNREMLTRGRLGGAFGGTNGRGHQLLATSGTTLDRRFRVAIRFADYQKKYANHLRQLYVVGWRLGMRSAALHNSGHGHFKGRYSGERAHREPWHRVRDLAFAVAHRRLVPAPYDQAFTGDESTLARWYRDLKRHAPVLLDAFYMNVLMLQDYIERNRLEPLSIPIVFVLHSLTDGARERLARTVGARVFNRYAPHECEGIAVACEANRGMHVAIDSYVVELLTAEEKAAGPGETGRIVITDLENHAMPLIRYDIGDLGRALDGACPCGRGFPLIGDLEGRRQDAVTSEAGGLVTPFRLERVFQGDPEARFFQVLAHGARIRVDVVPRDRELTPEATRRYTARLRALLGEAVAIEIRSVARVGFERNGKYSFVKRLSLHPPGT
jgi:phenylacetate-coenzyme A ligase PaaK-like adenylate-forming protein